jgi:hypothetical protein
VPFRTGPSFFGTDVPPQRPDCFEDCGQEVPISLYSTDELRKVVRFSLETLERNGLGRAKSFRCGGWMARQDVRDAVGSEGLLYEHSAVPPALLKAGLGTIALYGWLTELWPNITDVSQPFALPTAGGSMTEIPDNGALANYMTAQQMVDVFEKNKALFLQDPSRNVVVSMGFHEENAARDLPKFEEALARIFATASAHGLPLESATSRDIPAPARLPASHP